MTRKRIASIIPRVPEKAEQAAIVKLLWTVGANVYVLGHPSPDDGRAHRGTGQTKGLPDLMAFVPNRERGGHDLLMIEAKAKGGRLSPAQRAFERSCVDADVAHIVGGVDIVIAWLRRRGLVK